ncbi:MAG: TlpA family protein disulfide reductase [Acidobacteria bacterium]|nr:MAG: TlpA family protein disulfide reductase [Acidobacteriota bacterium]
MPELDAHTRENALGLVRWILLVLGAAALLAIAMTLVARSIPVDSPLPPEEVDLGFPPADFRLTTLDGGVLGPPDFAGKVVVIDFWATWCGPCRVQAEVLHELHERYDPGQVQFLAIDVAEDAETVRSFVADSPFPYPVLLDADGSVASRYQAHGLPTLMVIDKEGRVAYHRIGITDADKLAQELARAGVES